MGQVVANPVKGLPYLLAALRQVEKGLGHDGSAEISVPFIFELSAKSMPEISPNDAKPVLIACAVIELCVKIRNKSCVMLCQKVRNESSQINVEHVILCQRQLACWLKHVQMTAADHALKNNMPCYKSSREAKAIALATSALFRLESHASQSKQEFSKSGGIPAALKAMEDHVSGMTLEAKQSLAEMLNSLLDHAPQYAEGILEDSGHHVLITYVEDPQKYGVPKGMLAHLRAVLEICLQEGHNVPSKRMERQNTGDSKTSTASTRTS